MQVRNLATVGGNICNASPSGDTLPALMAYGAECTLSGPAGQRVVPLDQLFSGPGQTVLTHDEILTEITLPPPSRRDTGSLYIKHSPRGAMDIATVGVSSLITVDQRTGQCVDARIALGAVAPTPLRAHSAEELLKGRPDRCGVASGSSQRGNGAGRLPLTTCEALQTTGGEMVGVLTRRTLEHAAATATGAPLAYGDHRRLCYSDGLSEL